MRQRREQAKEDTTRRETVPRIRIFEKTGVKVWLVDDRGRGLRELKQPIAHLPGKVDWAQTAATCRPIGNEGLEIDLVFEKEGS